MAERIFRVISLAFLSVGFVVAVAGADKEGAQDLANATTDLIQHVNVANEVNAMNATSQSNKGITLTSDTNFVAQAKMEDEEPTIITPEKTPSKAALQTLPPQAN